MKTFASAAIALAFLLSVSAATPSYAKTKAKKNAEKTWTGILADNHCGPTFAKKSPNAGMKEAMGHPRSCAMKKSCAAAGYGLYCNGKWYSFDAAGNKQAAAWLAKTTQDKDLKVAVTGTMNGKTIAVASLKPAAEK